MLALRWHQDLMNHIVVVHLEEDTSLEAVASPVEAAAEAAAQAGNKIILSS